MTFYVESRGSKHGGCNHIGTQISCYAFSVFILSSFFPHWLLYNNVTFFLYCYIICKANLLVGSSNFLQDISKKAVKCSREGERLLRSVHTKDYDSYDPSPTFGKPPFKLIPN